jgi:hypothetical protein
MCVYWRRQEDVNSPQARRLAEWRAAAWRVADAWEMWRAARGSERADAHARYLAALGDEELAARRLERQAVGD